MTEQTEQMRYHLVDGLRGLAVVNMVLFHFLYDVNMIYGRDTSWYAAPATRLWQQAICWTFILAAGFVWRFGRAHALRRGLLLNLCGLVITGVTLLAVPGEAVWFGILNFIGCAVLLLLPLDKLLGRVPPAAGLCGSFLLFGAFRFVQRGYLGFFGWRLLELPRSLYEIGVLTPFGFPFPGFASSDYFPLLPWLFLFLCGYFAQPLLAARPAFLAVLRRRVPLLSCVGRYSLFIYLAHQPVCMALCQLLL